MERNPRDVPCGGLVRMHEVGWCLLSVGKRTRDVISKMHQRLGEAEGIILRPHYTQRPHYGEFFDNIRLRYVMGELDEDTWKQRVFLKERCVARTKVKMQILRTFLTLGVERFRDLYESKTRTGGNWTTPPTKVNKFVKEMRSIRNYINKTLEEELGVLGSSVFPKIDYDKDLGWLDFK